MRKLSREMGQYTLGLQAQQYKILGNLLLQTVLSVFQGKKEKEDFFTVHVFK